MTINREEKKLQIQTFLSGGMKEIYPADVINMPAIRSQICLLKPLSLKRKIGVGLDFFWNFKY